MNTNIHIRKFGALALAILMICALCVPALAATVPNAVIDYSAKGSISLYKYDLTSAEKDGFVPDSIVATGLPEAAAEAALAPYAIEGVEYTYLKIAPIETFTGIRDGVYTVEVQYGVNDTELESLLGIGIAQASRTVGTTHYYNMDVLNHAMTGKLESEKSAFKTALESYIMARGTAMPETDANGHTSVSNLPLGLYLVVETRVPEIVSCTTAPWLLSVPMTTIDGGEWNYDITAYPKNQTDMPTLEKTVREAAADTGHNNGLTNDITDGYSHIATASAGDTVEYQIVSTLPAITSQASRLTTYTFVDTLSKGIEYAKNDVKLEWFRDAACRDLVTTWLEADGKFTVSYGTAAEDATTMTIAMTSIGLADINTSTAIYPATSKERGFSQLTLRITYACTVNSNADLVLGDEGNPNTVTLTWIRSNLAYRDTLTDDCHVFSYGVDLTKLFSDDAGNFAHVNFVAHNDTDDYFVKAVQVGGIYYVTGHAAGEADATVLVPTDEGKIILRGLEDDTYTWTETHTDDRYKLLAQPIEIRITTADGVTCTTCGASCLTASATIDGNACTMLDDGTSVSALAALNVVNFREPDVPHTGDTGTWMFTVGGMILCASAVLGAVYFSTRKRKHTR